MALQRKTSLMVKDLEGKRVERVQKLQISQKVFDQNASCTLILLEKDGFQIHHHLHCSVIGQMLLEDIISVRPASLVEAFVRVRRQKEDWDKWKPPAKGNIK